MYRSVSTNRVSPDDHFSYESKASQAIRALSLEASELPVYEPLSEASKKEKTRTKVAENVVHLIPLVLIICGLVLWLLSSPYMDVKGHSSGANVEGMTIDGDLDSDGAEHLPVELAGDLDPTKKGEPKTLFTKRFN